ncbi:hypothetical protein [Deinococcus yunweiensis]|uniref:hypothetical protein n=1 Tax=Deinococcus yunweiensis TaxID=367282 RepID=UPI00398F2CB5
MRGPIGSSCIFTHVLGLERARAYGTRFHALMRSLAAPTPDLGLQEDEELDYSAYLRRLSLEYLLDGQVRLKARLTAIQLEAFERTANAGQPLSPAQYAALLRRGERVSERLASTPLERELPWDLHAGRPLQLARRPTTDLTRTEEPSSLEQSLNFHNVDLSVAARWEADENGDDLLRVIFSRGSHPFYRPYAVDLRCTEDAAAFGRFLCSIEETTGALRKKSGSDNECWPAGHHLQGSLEFQAYFVPRAAFPVEHDTLWHGRATVLDIRDRAQPRAQTLRLYQTRDGTWPPRSTLTELGTWITGEAEQLNRP